MRVVGEVADLIDGEEVRARIVPQAAFEGAGGLLAVEVEHEVRRGDEQAGVAGEDGLVDEILGEHRLAETLGAHQDDVGAAEEIERWERIQVAKAEARRRALAIVELASQGHSLARPWKRRKSEITEVQDLTPVPAGQPRLPAKRHVKIVEEEIPH